VSVSLSTNRSVEVFIVDHPSAAGVALGAPRTEAESTHVLCRHADESTPDFARRVLRRLERIQRGRRVRSLCHVLGSEGALARNPVPLLRALVPSLERGATLTVVGPSSSQRRVFEWIDALMEATRGEIEVRAQLYADGDEAAVLRSAARRANAAAAHPLPAAARSPFPFVAGDGARGFQQAALGR
jgi:hypothetical protein